MQTADSYAKYSMEPEGGSNYPALIAGTSVLAGLYLASLYSYTLFHSLAELFSIVIAFSVFVIAWNSRPFLNNNYFLLIGIAYLFIGGIDLIHTLAYKGMGVFKTYDANHPTQLWIAARYMQSVSLLAAPFFVGRRLGSRTTFAAYAAVFSLLLWSIFGSDAFPVCYIEGAGLTPFKKNSEYVISLILITSGVALLRKKDYFDNRVLSLILLSISATILSELAFTFYVGVYDLSNLIGHVLKIGAFYFTYLAIIKTGIREPFHVIFRDLKHREEELREAKEELELRVKERTRQLSESNELLHGLNRKLQAISRCNQTLLRADDEQSLLNDVCRIVCEEAGYRMAWVGYAEDDDARTVRPAASAGFDDGYLDAARITWADVERGRGPTGIAIRTGKVDCIQDFSTETKAAPWRNNALQRGYRSSISLPLSDDRNRTFGALTIYSTDPQAFAAGEIALLEELAGDLAYGITVLRARVDRRRVEQDLMLMDFALNNVQEAAFLIDETAHFQYVNNESCRVLGYTCEELLGLSVADVDPDFPAERWAGHWKDLKNNGSLTFEGRHRTKDGRIFPVEISANYFEYDGRGYNLALVRDITERKQAEEALRISEGRYRMGQEIGHIGNWEYNLQTTEFWGSDEAKRIYGFDPEQTSFSTEEVENCIPERERVHQALVDLIGSLKPYNLEFEIRPRNSKESRFIASVAELQKDENGNPLKIAGVIQDITDRKRAEEALRLSEESLRRREAMLTESQRVAHIGSWDWDAVADTIWWSDEYYHIYGIDPTKPPPNYLDHLKAYTPESAQRLAVAVRRAMETGEPYELDLELVKPTETTRWILARGEVKRDAKGQIVGLRGTAQNISYRKKDEEEIRRLNQELERRITERTKTLEGKSLELQENQRALMNLVEDLNLKTGELEEVNVKLKELDRLKSMFIASMSHELRTPLNSIIGFTGVILMGMTGAITEEQRKQLGMVKESASHLLSLINDIIDVSKIEAGKVQLSVESVDVSAVIEEVRNSFDIASKTKELLLSSTVPERLMVETDRRRLKQVLVNFLSNAIKFTSEGEIAIEAIKRDEAIEISVRDTGIGIKEEDMTKLFRAFSQVGAEGKAREGSGLGLYICRKIAELLAGEITARSEFGKGSTFALILPLQYKERET